MGPGTRIEKRLVRGDPGKNRLDRIAKQDDIAYGYAKNLQGKWRADEGMIRSIDRLPGKKTLTEKNSEKNNASQETSQDVIFYSLLKNKIGC